MKKEFMNTYGVVDLHGRIIKYMAGVKNPIVLLHELRGLAQGLTKGAYNELLRSVEKSIIEKQGGKL